MKKILLSAVSIMLALCIFASPAAALEFDGASSGGSGGNINASGGYAVEFTSNKAVGYRFSLIDESGGAKGTNIDIFRKATGSEYISLNHFSAKFSKYQLIQIYNKTKFTTVSGNGADDYYDTSFSLSLPEKTDGMASWQVDSKNINPILRKITGNSSFNTSSLTYGDKLLIEPIWCVKVDNKSCVLTVSELGIVGGSKFGFNTVPSSSNTQGSWGFIASYTNRVYPNALFTPDGMGLWNGVSAAGSNLSFKNMIIKGYGVAIAYTASTNCKVTVTYVPNGGTVYGSTSNVTKTYDINTTITLPSAERSQYTFGGWYTALSGGSKYGTSGSKYTLKKNVIMYAHWQQSKYVVRYYPGEGSGTHQDKYNQTVIYGTATQLRNYTDVGFSKYGYKFKGYMAYRTEDKKYLGYDSSGKSGWYAKESIDASYGFNGYNLYCKDGAAQSVSKTAKSGYVDLTAQYEPNKITIKYNPNSDGNFTVDGAADYKNVTGSMDDTILTYQVPVKLRKNTFAKSGYTFGGSWVAFRDYDNKYYGYNSNGVKGWYDKASIDASYGFNGYVLYADEQSVSATAPSGTVYMFAVWNVNQITIKYNPNSDSNFTVDGAADYKNVTGSMDDTVYNFGKAVALRKNAFKKTGNVFANKWVAFRDCDNKYLGFNAAGDVDWFDATEITQYRYLTDGSAFPSGTVPSGTVYMFAVWNANQITIKYNPNSDSNFTVDGAADYKNVTGSMDDTVYNFGKAVALRKNAFKKTGNVFANKWVAFRDCDNKYLGFNAAGDVDWFDATEITQYRYLTDGSAFPSGTVPSGTVYMFAVWNANQITIKYNPNSDSNFTVDGAADYKFVTGSMDDTILTYQVPVKLRKNTFAKSGYTFGGSWVAFRDCDNKYYGYNSSGVKGWYDKASIDASYGFNGYVLYADEQSVSATAPSGTVYMFAVWNANSTYTVSYDLNGGSGTFPNQTKQQNVSIELHSDIPTRTGYKFLYWKERATGTQYNPGDVYTNNANAVMVAQWTADDITYTVQYILNGGSGTFPNQTKKKDVDINIYSKAPEKDEYDFIGWLEVYTGVTYKPGALYTKNADAVLVAQWKPAEFITYTVSYDLNGGSGTFPNQTKQQNVSIELHSDIPTRTGYKFLYWKERAAGTQYNPGDVYTNNANAVMVAQWKPIQYTIRFNGYGGVGSMDDMTCFYGAAYNLTANAYTKIGYRFLNWLNIDNGYNYSDKEEVANLTTQDGEIIYLYAMWSPIRYTVRFNANGGSGTMDDMNCTYDYTYNLTANAFTKTGYKFALWVDMAHSIIYNDKESIKNLTTEHGAVITLYAMWSPIRYTVRFNANGGSGTMDDMNCTYDTAYNLTANAFTKTGYKFALWVDMAHSIIYNDKESIKNLTTEHGAVITLYAMWSPIRYTVRFNANGGSGTMDDMNCTYDTAYNLNANAFVREGYIFKGWTCSLDGKQYSDRQKIENMTTQDGAVIFMYAIWEISKKHTDLSIEANEIFGDIKQGYDICVSATVINNGTLDITPDLAASVKMTAENGNGIFDVQTLEGVIVPGINIQLVWFKVYIPYSSLYDLTFTYEIIPNSNVIDDNLDDNSSDRAAVSSEYVITNTDIPDYELNAENGFSSYLSSCGRTKDTFMWQYWVWKDGDFEIVTETYTPDDGYKVVLTPTASAGWKEKDGENYKTRSGYGIEVNAEFPMLSTLIGTLRLDILYPENNFSYEDKLYSSMDVVKTGDNLYTASLPYYSEAKYKNAHYTPMWFPDGDYEIEIHGTGLWTPVGEVTFTAGSTNTLTIEGSLWDDYYSTYYGNVKDK